MRELRSVLFLKAVKRHLAECGDVLVMRKKIGGAQTAKEKHAENIWTLVNVVEV